MKLIREVNGVAEDYSFGRLRQDNPNVSFPRELPVDGLPDYNVYPVEPLTEPKPVFDNLTQAVRRHIIKEDGKYVERWQYYLLSADEVKANFTNEIQRLLDGFAKTKNYDSILSAASYAASTGKYRLEGVKAAQLRDQMWEKSEQIFAEVEAGTRPMPERLDEIIDELPDLTWD